MDELESFQNSDSISVASANINNAISDIHSSKPVDSQSLADSIESNEIGNLRFTHFLEQWEEIIDIRIRYPDLEDLNIPAELGSSRHKAETLVLDVDFIEDGEFKTESVPVVVKLMTRAQAEAELLVYSDANLENSLKVFGMFIDETESMGSRRSSMLITVADSNLVAIETRLKAQVALIEQIVSTPNFESSLSRIKSSIKYLITNSYLTFEELHRQNIIHGDPASRNVLQDVINGTFLLCDFEAARDLNKYESSEETKLQKGIELRDYIGSIFVELNKFLNDRDTIDAQSKEIIRDMFTELNKEVLEETKT